MEEYFEQIIEILDTAKADLSKEEYEYLLDELNADCTDRSNEMITFQEDLSDVG